MKKNILLSYSYLLVRPLSL